MIAQIADRLYRQMERATRDNGTEFWRKVDGAEEVLADLIQEAHGDTFPDDYTYSMVADALSAISEMDEDADEDDIRDELIERLDGSVPVYNGQLAAWLASSVYRGGYVDDAVEELGYPDNGIYAALMQGYWYELREVADSVLSSLAKIAEEEEEAADDDDE